MVSGQMEEFRWKIFDRNVFREETQAHEYTPRDLGRNATNISQL